MYRIKVNTFTLLSKRFQFYSGLIIMLALVIMLLLKAVALPNITYPTPILLTRVILVVLLPIFGLSFNPMYIQAIGLDCDSIIELFLVTSVSQMIDTFLDAVASLPDWIIGTYFLLSTLWCLSSFTSGSDAATSVYNYVDNIVLLSLVLILDQMMFNSLYTSQLEYLS